MNARNFLLYIILESIKSIVVELTIHCLMRDYCISSYGTYGVVFSFHIKESDGKCSYETD